MNAAMIGTTPGFFKWFNKAEHPAELLDKLKPDYGTGNRMLPERQTPSVQEYETRMALKYTTTKYKILQKPTKHLLLQQFSIF